MYNILIVDDESSEREGIKNLIQRFQYALKIFQACNGEEALKIIEQNEIDILLTDIKMPFMNGIELIEEVHRRNWAPISIIYSAYGEFEYAQNAISLGVMQYLLKPVRLDEFKKLFDKVIQLCEKKLMQQQKHIEVQKKIKKLDEKQKYYELLFFLESEDYSKVVEKQFNIIFKDTSWIPMILVGRGNIFTNIWEQYKEKLKQSIGSDMITILQENDQILFLIPGLKDYTDIYKIEICEKLIKIYERFYQNEVYIIIGELCESIKTLKNMYCQMKDYLDYQFFLSESSYIIYNKNNILQKKNDMLPLYSGKIITYAKLNNYDGLKKEFEKMFNYINNSTGFSSIYIRYSITDIVKEMCKIMNLDQMLIRVVENIYLSKTLDDIRQTVRELLDTISLENKNIQKKENRQVWMAKEIVKERYKEHSLNVSSIADELHVSIAYLSTLFKMETGTNLVKYIAHYRIQIAKNLLETTNIKINDIAEAVGYLNTSYFISLFKNKVGYSPTQYREKKYNDD